MSSPSLYSISFCSLTIYCITIGSGVYFTVLAWDKDIISFLRIPKCFFSCFSNERVVKKAISIYKDRYSSCLSRISIVLYLFEFFFDILDFLTMAYFVSILKFRRKNDVFKSMVEWQNRPKW